MSDDYDLLVAPWHVPSEDTPLRHGDEGRSNDTHTITLLDQLCELMTTTYIAERMGNRTAFAKAAEATARFVEQLPPCDLWQMAMFAVTSHATLRAAFCAEQIPQGVPPEWLSGGAV